MRAPYPVRVIRRARAMRRYPYWHEEAIKAGDGLVDEGAITPAERDRIAAATKPEQIDSVLAVLEKGLRNQREAAG